MSAAAAAFFDSGRHGAGSLIRALIKARTIRPRRTTCRRTPALSFGPPKWLPADALDDAYFRLLPSGQSTVTAEEAAVLAAVFAEDGELPARSAGTSRWSTDFRQPA
jgi:hypothetical protein